jgi:hypothetical protein
MKPLTMAILAMLMAAPCYAQRDLAAELAERDASVKASLKKFMDVYNKATQDEIMRQVRAKPKPGDPVCDWTLWGGHLCRQPGENSYSFYRSIGDPPNHVTAATIERVKTRCDYKAKTFFVDDALQTRKEIFDECMNYELMTAGR